MIDNERKLEVCGIMGFRLIPATSVQPNRGSGWIFIYQPVKDTGSYIGGPLDGGWESKDQAIDAMWSHCVKRFDLYLHKKGGIYLKQDERPVHDTDITVVNYEHIHPHERAPGCRTKSEWETPGRFVKITV